MERPFLPYARQSIQESDRQAVVNALKGDVITRGVYVETFEKAVADYCGAKYAVAFNSASSALMGTYFAAKVSPYDRVISSPNTFIATVGGALHHQADLQFSDIDRQTGNLDLDQLKEKMRFYSTRGRLILVPVHFAGIALDMQALDQLVEHPDVVIIEDAAHALGSHYPDGQKVGCCAWSHMTVFSFHPAKTLTTGEGGMVLTNKEELYHRLQLYRNNGIEREAPYLEKAAAPGYYEVQAITGNFNFTDFQAALGLSQLERLETFISQRRQLMKKYREQLQSISSIRLFTHAFDQQTAFHLCVVQIDFKAHGKTREAVMNQLKERGIGTQVHYIPLYHHPIIQRKKGDQSLYFPEMEGYYAQTLSLPLYYDLQETEVERVCQELLTVLQI